ncbi:MAG: cell division protein ZapA [Pseudomonadota bacterium]
MTIPRTIEISLLGRTFKVPCSKEEEPQLIAAVEYLDGKMREIRENSKAIGVERIAMMAGLNIAHELLTSGGGASREPEYRERLAAMEAELDRALADQDHLFGQP